SVACSSELPSSPTPPSLSSSFLLLLHAKCLRSSLCSSPGRSPCLLPCCSPPPRQQRRLPAPCTIIPTPAGHASAAPPSYPTASCCGRVPQHISTQSARPEPVPSPQRHRSACCFAKLRQLRHYRASDPPQPPPRVASAPIRAS